LVGYRQTHATYLLTYLLTYRVSNLVGNLRKQQTAKSGGDFKIVTALPTTTPELRCYTTL